jgi:ubiquinone/menaquinone biosynthesis C-methylase UbiE
MVSGSGLKNREEGKAFTLHHYTKTLAHKSNAFNRVFPLYDYFKPMIGNKKEVKIADVGAGMFSTTGSVWPGVKIEVYPSDELANEYMQVLKEQNIKPLFPIEKQNMEALTYADNSFDIVHCVNALDHVENPDKAILEMYRICKSGGWIYMRHYFNTADKQKFRGMHHWNITMTINRDCIFLGKSRYFVLSKLVPGFVNVPKKEINEKVDMVVSTLFVDNK